MADYRISRRNLLRGASSISAVGTACLLPAKATEPVLNDAETVRQYLAVSRMDFELAIRHLHPGIERVPLFYEIEKPWARFEQNDAAMLARAHHLINDKKWRGE